MRDIAASADRCSCPLFHRSVHWSRRSSALRWPLVIGTARISTERWSKEFAWNDHNVVDGVRQNAADAYLSPALGRPNLTVVTEATVQRLLIQDGRCTGIDYSVSPNGNAEAELRAVRAAAQAGVILATGAIGTPHLLMVSGIGPAAHLREHGVDVLLDSPGVGSNLHDHPLSGVVYSLSDEASAAPAEAPEMFVVRPPGDPALDGRLDAMMVCVNIPVHSPAVTGPARGYTIAVGLMQPASRGTVRLAGPDISVPPAVDPNYLGEAVDRQRMVRALWRARSIGGHLSLAGWRKDEALPGGETETEEQCLDYLRRSITPFYHPAGTCRMGQDGDAVVGSNLCVRGVGALYVVDSSVMPSPVSANTHATVLAVAERAADLIRDHGR